MNRVDVWVAPLDVTSPILAWLIPCLSPAERDRARRYRSVADARRFSVARAWLRHVLAGELGTAAADVTFAAGGGKPRLAGGDGPRFNLSHAGELALVAVSESEVGVDVEPLTGGAAALDAADLACTPAEAAALDRLPPEDRAKELLRLWTAKEAYLKALGVGLTVAPHTVGVDALGPAWSVRELAPAPGYIGAVAAEGDGWDLELHHVLAAVTFPETRQNGTGS